MVDGTAQLLHLERPTLKRHLGAPLPAVGDEVPISLSNGQPPVRAKVYGLDTITEPPRARVVRMDTGEEILVDVVCSDGSPRAPMSWVALEVGRAMGEVRSKGCGVLKDGVLDTVDIVTEGAQVAFNGAQQLGRHVKAAEPLAPSNPSLEQMQRGRIFRHLFIITPNEPMNEIYLYTIIHLYLYINISNTHITHTDIHI